MLENIKSKYILSLIFSYLEEKQILKIITYNKLLQNKLEIDLDSFEDISKRYKIAPLTGKGKEYTSSNKKILLYEGEYLNGKRHGKGKEYFDNGKIEYEGEYLNGERSGKGKEYYKVYFGVGQSIYYFVKLKYEGEYLHGKMHGKGKLYSPINEDKLQFQGEFRNGKKWDGKIYDYCGKVEYEIKNGNGIGEIMLVNYSDEVGDCHYIGEYKNGERNGKGKEYDGSSYLIYEGEYLNGKKWNGKGYDTEGNIIYEIKNGNGEIKVLLHTKKGLGCIFNGEYKNGNITKGKFYHCGNLVFEGEYLNGEFWNGIYYEYDDDDHKILEGEIKNGKLNGKGKEYYINGKLKFEGEYLKDKRWNGKIYDRKGLGNIILELKNGNGEGKEYYTNTNLKFEGKYLNGLKHGKGKEYFSSGALEYDGEYLNGLKHGKGKLYDIKLHKIFEGEFYKGEKWNGIGKEFDEYVKKYDVEYINGIRHEIKEINNDKKYTREFLLDSKKNSTNNEKMSKEEHNKNDGYYCILF